MRRAILAIRFAGFVLLVCALLAQQLFAHYPIFTEDAATSSETAIPMKAPDISQVVYREITEKTSQVWLAVTVPKDFELFIQVGVPAIERFKDFRPAVVLVGPGLPGKEVPFKLPKDLGAKVYSTKDVEKPRFFHEHFTNTDSWILRSETVRLSDPGRYYLVAFSPQGQTGKLWLSIGTKESFGPGDLKQFQAWAKRIQEFHEVAKK